ncbi:MAG: hypothetical protein GVY13_19690 [Alphaproteobacteria bacterium]|jgi:hypothetical protein|nr:hypothetical protein [Alphaproteobacteria bacterium]
MSAVTWPLTVRPRRQSFWLATRSTQFDNPFSAATQRLDWAGMRWRAELLLRRMGPAVREIDGLVAALEGLAGSVLLPDFRRLAARNPLGSPTLSGGSGATLAVTDLGGTLLPGDLIQIETGRAVMVTATVAAGASVSVPIAPPLRQPVAIGPLITDAVRVRMRLVDDAQTANPTTAAARAEWRLAFEEVPS